MQIRHPLAYQPVDSGVLKLNDQQKVGLERIRKTFVQQIGGPNQDPKDPQYFERWQTAQATADNQLYLLLGQDTYFRYTRESQQQARNKFSGL